MRTKIGKRLRKMERRGENHVINFINILMNNGGQANCLKFFLLSVLPDILGGQLNILSIDRLFLICIYIVRLGQSQNIWRKKSNNCFLYKSKDVTGFDKRRSMLQKKTYYVFPDKHFFYSSECLFGMFSMPFTGFTFFA